MTKTKNGMFELQDAGNTLRNELEDNNTNWQVVEDTFRDGSLMYRGWLKRGTDFASLTDAGFYSVGGGGTNFYTDASVYGILLVIPRKGSSDSQSGFIFIQDDAQMAVGVNWNGVIKWNKLYNPVK